jgi:hypothetical protein
MLDQSLLKLWGTMNIEYKSYNNKHTANLIYEGEIRFGPDFYKLSINKKLLRTVYLAVK